MQRLPLFEVINTKSKCFKKFNETEELFMNFWSALKRNQDSFLSNISNKPSRVKKITGIGEQVV